MVSPDSRYFDWVDYSVFGLLLTGSVCIGIFFGFFSKRKQNTKLEYLLGSREIGLIPLAMSLIATQFSGVPLMGYPTEMYVYGTQAWTMLFLDVVMGPVMAFWYIPVFYNLDQISMYEYLNKRFSPAVRTIGSILFVVKMLMILPVMIYGPALALAQVSSFSLQIIIPITCMVCTFYTTIGGMKAVVWTDSLQFIVMATFLLFVTIAGTAAVGGFSKLLEINERGDRFEFFNMSLDPTVRHTFWNTFIGNHLYRLTYFFVNQGTLQRCMATPNLKTAKWATIMLVFGITIFMNTCMYIGLMVYAAFADCDPISTGLVRKPDQILPYFVMHFTSHIPALRGIFLSAVFSASLSTMSSGLNSMSGIVIEDFVQPFFKAPIGQERASLLMKTVSVVLGMTVMGLAFFVERLSGLVQGTHSVGSAAAGSLMGALLLGMFLPWANSHGALAGTVSALSLITWLAFGQQKAMYDKRIVYPKKPVSVAGCDKNTLEQYYNMTTHLNTLRNVTAVPMDPPFCLYRISYNWYTPIALTTVLTVGMLVSWMTGLNNPRDMDRQLFSPAIQRFLPKSRRQKHEKNATADKVDGLPRENSQPLLLRRISRENTRERLWQ